MGGCDWNQIKPQVIIIKEKLMIFCEGKTGKIAILNEEKL